jgi:hypothetical protein
MINTGNLPVGFAKKGDINVPWNISASFNKVWREIILSQPW